MYTSVNFFVCTHTLFAQENLAVDVDAIVSDFAVMGEGLVKSVEVL